MDYTKIKKEYTMNQISIPEHINKEFRAGYIYLSMSNEKNNYIHLAKEKIETGMKFFESFILANPTFK